MLHQVQYSVYFWVSLQLLGESVSANSTKILALGIGMCSADSSYAGFFSFGRSVGLFDTSSFILE